MIVEQVWTGNNYRNFNYLIACPDSGEAMAVDPQYMSLFTDGITEDITTLLSRFRNLMVIARNSSFVYKGQAVSAQRIGADLNVAYVVEGSVRRLMFTNLPPSGTIQIFTASGQFLQRLRWEAADLMGNGDLAAAIEVFEAAVGSG